MRKWFYNGGMVWLCFWLAVFVLGGVIWAKEWKESIKTAQAGQAPIEKEPTSVRQKNQIIRENCEQFYNQTLNSVAHVQKDSGGINGYHSTRYASTEQIHNLAIAIANLAKYNQCLANQNR